MLEISLFFLFSFLALAIFAVGKFTNSTLIMFIGGIACLFTGLMVLPGGVGQYDGTYNVSYNYSCLQCLEIGQEREPIIPAGGYNLTVMQEFHTPNFKVYDGWSSTTVGLIDVLLGLVMIYYYYVSLSRPIRE